MDTMDSGDLIDDNSDYESDITNVGEDPSGEPRELDLLVPSRIYVANVEITAETVISAWVEAIIECRETPPVLEYYRCSMIKDSEPIMCLWVASEDVKWAGNIFQTIAADKWEEMAANVGLETSVYMSLFGATDMGTGNNMISMVGNAESGGSDNGVGNYILLLPILLRFDSSVDTREHTPLIIYYDDAEDFNRRPGTFVKNDSFRKINEEKDIAEGRLRSVIEPAEDHTNRRVKITLHTKQTRNLELRQEGNLSQKPFNFTKEWWENGKTVKRII